MLTAAVGWNRSSSLQGSHHYGKTRQDSAKLYSKISPTDSFSCSPKSWSPHLTFGLLLVVLWVSSTGKQPAGQVFVVQRQSHPCWDNSFFCSLPATADPRPISASTAALSYQPNKCFMVKSTAPRANRSPSGLPILHWRQMKNDN